VQIALLDDVPVNKTNLFEPCTEMSLLSGLLRGLIEILASANPSFRISFASAGILEGTGPRQVQRARGSESTSADNENRACLNAAVSDYTDAWHEKLAGVALRLALAERADGRIHRRFPPSLPAQRFCSVGV
jgi:hypothetical protein